MNEEIKENLKSIILSAITLVIAVIIEKTCNFPMWANLLVFMVPYLIAGGEVIKEAIEELFHGEFMDEDFLMTVATIGALLIGFIPGAEAEFAEAVFVMLFFKVGELFETIAEAKSEKSIESLMEIRPDVAYIEDGNSKKEVDAKEVKIGDEIIVSPGEKIPLDGLVVKGTSSVNASALTGESIPISVEPGDNVQSGCVNQNGILTIKVEKTFEESTASKIIDLVKNATENKSKSEKFITKFAKVYTPIVVGIAIILAIIPPIVSGDFKLNFSTWLLRSLTFLIVSCPCALVVSIPLAFFGGIGGASRAGILVKGANYLESLAKLDTVVMDKTGTITEGVFEVVDIHSDVISEQELLHLAAHVESFSSHPIALSLIKAYGKKEDDCDFEIIEEIAGKGIRAKVNGKEVVVGNEKLMDKISVECKDCDKCKNAGTIVHVSIDGKYAGHIVISDRIKEDSKEAIKKLNKEKIRTIMLTGDKKSIAENIAKEVAISEYYAELLPEGKVEKLENIMKEKKGLTAFVGDGINDAPVLARADMGIAMGAMGSDAAIEAADVVLMDDNPIKISKAIEISRKAIKIAKQNIVFAIGVKILVLILAALGYAPMWLAVFADVGVTILAFLNSIRTLR